VESCRIANAAGLRQFEKGVDSLNLEYIPSAANFITLKVGDGKAAFEAMQGDGVIVRPLAPYGMGEWVRITIGTEEQNDRALESLTSFLSRECE